MTRWRSISVAALAVLLAACTEDVKPRGHDASAEIDAWSQSFSGAAAAPREKKTGKMVMAREDGPAWDWSDPCVENLHEVTGLLLLYFHQHQELPESLASMTSTAPGGGEALLHCPATGKAYVYVREGLVPPLDIVPEPQRAAGGARLILYDAEPAHDVTQHLTDGTKDWDLKKKIRYGVVMMPRGADGMVMLEVVPVEQALLDAYLREAKERASNNRVRIQQLPLRPLNSGVDW